MPTQKVFKRRVRARMSKTGESYTAARRHLLPTSAPEVVADGVMLVADESMVRATGRSHVEWFAILDAWGAMQRRHTEIARWLGDAQGVPPWWTQNLTVAYERARGMRATHQMADGFSVSVTRTVAVDTDRALTAFTDPVIRRRWLPAGSLEQRPTRAALTRRFDWADPSSRVVVTVASKGSGKTTVSVSHEKLPDAETGERLKAAWRDWLDAMKALVEGG